MPAAALKPAKAAPPQDFLTKLANLNKADVATALTAYRALVFALADDSTHEADEAHVIEVLAALKITQADLKHDVETVLSLRIDEAQLLSPEKRAAMDAERKELLDTARKYQEALPHLRGKARSIDTMTAGDGVARGEINRRKQVHHRLFSDVAEVERRIEQGLPTGPRADGKTGGYVPAMMFGPKP